MAKQLKLNPIAAALGLSLAATLAAAPIAQANTNPFGVSEIANGYMVAGAEKTKKAKEGSDKKATKEGKCGEGKCGEGKTKEGKCGEGKAKEGKCGDDKAKEGKCGEGKCGEGKKKAASKK